MHPCLLAKYSVFMGSPTTPLYITPPPPPPRLGSPHNEGYLRIVKPKVIEGKGGGSRGTQDVSGLLAGSYALRSRVVGFRV